VGMNESESENKFKEVAQRFRLNASLLAARIFTFKMLSSESLSALRDKGRVG